MLASWLTSAHVISKLPESEKPGMMSEAHREFLRKYRDYIKRNLEVDVVWPQMTDVLDRNCEDKIRAESTPEARTLELLHLLPRRGDKAFISFIRATLKVQIRVGEHLADLAGLNVNHILPSATQRETEEPGMKEVHRQILVNHLSTFKQSLNVAEIVESLSNNVAITSRNPGVNIRTVLQEPSMDKKVEKLICDMLPRLGPDAFQYFFKTLDKNQPQLAHDLRQSIKATHPGELIDERQCYQESTNIHVTGQTTAQFNLETTWSDLPDHVQRKLEERLNKGNELLENDWRSLYKAVNLPQGKENIIAERFSDNPTQYVLNTWFDRDGQRANVKALLLALKKCNREGLVHEIERVLDVKLPDQVSQDTVDGVRDMQLNENEKRTALRFVKEIPGELKVQLMKQLKQVSVDCLSEIATKILEVRCYVVDSTDFMDKLKEKKIRFLFRELRREGQTRDIVRWMRNKFPVGSTGPVKCDDNVKTENMNYGVRKEVTDYLSLEDWEILASHSDIDLKKLDIGMIKRRSADNPAEAVISRWEARNNSSVGMMYDLLVDCEFYKIADLL
ncbi:uncharacterized protein LOC124439182 [Xenia sp. Carnegie-2017]|uniref:uncharacterized protein LOC124439182 n=1 Tax=Xenia sp. Carnegie-2017 TaxID=2897299 RepID=UPI001F03ABAD|nr:uncharacterized protein LOC124439182 [Xenia sp. Carnegie-2017]